MAQFSLYVHKGGLKLMLRRMRRRGGRSLGDGKQGTVFFIYINLSYMQFWDVRVCFNGLLYLCCSHLANNTQVDCVNFTENFFSAK